MERYQATSGVPYVVYLFDPGGNLVHRVERDDVKVSGGSRLCSDTAIYDGQGLLHADIDVTSGGFEGTPGAGSEFDCVGYQGQSGAYTDLETVHTASGLYTGLTAPGGLTTYYDPLKGLGFSRRQEAVLNAYAQNINPFAGWTFGAYVSEVKQFGVGEIKGAVNYVADRATLGLVTDPLAAHGQNEQAGAETLPVIADTVQYVDGAGEVIGLVHFVRGGAAKIVAGAGSYFARKGGNCFVAGTPVQMADGTTKPIEQVKEGDLVKSRNPQTGKIEAKRVDRTYVRIAPQVMTLTFTDAHTGQTETFTCTPEHPFFVDGQGYVKAGDLGIGTSIVTRAGPSLTLSTVRWNAPISATSGSGLLLDGQAHPAGITVYNLRVEDFHNYFVGTQDGGTCVHNADYDLQQIANEIFEAGGKKPQHQTISAVRTVEGDIVVASNGSRNLSTGKIRGSYLSPAQRVVADRYGAINAKVAKFGKLHAEENAIGHAESVLGQTPSEIAASNRVCRPCEIIIRSKGIRCLTPFRGY